jgi:RimJ/RimL family protein N-acetyltransferase
MDEQKIILRKFMDEDIELFSYWLHKEYISKWYEHPNDWLDEVQNREDKYQFIHHLIVMHENNPIGFCQYYDCFYAKEDWYNVSAANEMFSIDYLIGNEEYLQKGYGKQIIEVLTDEIRKKQKETKQIVVKPEKENIPSNKALLAAGYKYHPEKEYYYIDL